MFKWLLIMTLGTTTSTVGVYPTYDSCIEVRDGLRNLHRTEKVVCRKYYDPLGNKAGDPEINNGS